MIIYRWKREREIATILIKCPQQQITADKREIKDFPQTRLPVDFFYPQTVRRNAASKRNRGLNEAHC